MTLKTIMIFFSETTRNSMKKYPKNSVEWDYFSFLVNEYTSMTNG
jgi:hypothetical protein